MPRKIVKVYIPKEIKKMVEDMSEALGLDESELLRVALLDYASKHGVLSQILNHKSTLHSTVESPLHST